MQHSHSALVRLHLALVEESYAILNVAQHYQYFITIVAIAMNYVTQLIMHRIPYGQRLEATATANHTQFISIDYNMHRPYNSIILIFANINKDVT